MKGLYISLFMTVALAMRPVNVVAETNGHYQEAKRFYELTMANEPKQIVANITRLMISNTPELEAYQGVLAKKITEIIESREYVEGKIATYMEYLSQDDLKELNALFSHPSYQKYQNVRTALTKRSGERIMQLYQSKMPDIRAALEKEMRRRGEGNKVIE